MVLFSTILKCCSFEHENKKLQLREGCQITNWWKIVRLWITIRLYLDWYLDISGFVSTQLLNIFQCQATIIRLSNDKDTIFTLKQLQQWTIFMRSHYNLLFLLPKTWGGACFGISREIASEAQLWISNFLGRN